VQRCYPDHFDDPDDDTLAAAYAWPLSTPDRGTIRANMVAAIDAGATVDGRAAGLGSAADQRLLIVLRDLADVILVGAGTIRAEGYGGIALDARRMERRRRWGLAGPPPIAVVSGGDLDRNLRIFLDNEVRPIVITTTAGCARMAGYPAVVLDAGGVADGREHLVDLRAAVQALTEHGFRRILCEGGPSLLGGLVAEALVDELCLTTSPTLLGAGPVPLLGATRIAAPVQWRLESLHVDHSHVFSRYSRA